MCFALRDGESLAGAVVHVKKHANMAGAARIVGYFVKSFAIFILLGTPKKRRRCFKKNAGAATKMRHEVRTPRTLVTTNPEEVREFPEASGRRTIYKSLSSIRSIVNRLNDDDLGACRISPRSGRQMCA